MSILPLPRAKVPVVVVEGEVEPADIIGVRDRIAEALEGGHDRVVVDLRAATLRGTSTVSLFCGTLCRIDRRDGTIAVLGLPPHTRRVLELCGIEGVEHHSTFASARSF